MMIKLTLFQTVVSEAIEGHEEYSMVALQLGPTEASRYWIYWVPNQENNNTVNILAITSFETMPILDLFGHPTTSYVFTYFQKFLSCFLALA